MSLPLSAEDREKLEAYQKKAAADSEGVPAADDAKAGSDPLPDGFHKASSNEGVKLLEGATSQNKRTVDAWIEQSAPFSCGIASLAIVLGQDTTELAAFEHLAAAFPNFQLADVAAFPRLAPLLAVDFDPRASSLWIPAVLDLPNFEAAVNAAGRADAHPMVSFGFGAGFESEDSEEEACDRFRASLTQLNSTAIALSFDRVAAGQTGGGHWTPVAAYNAEGDMVLVLDTARRYGHYWAPVERIVQAMRTRNAYKQSRGWCCVGPAP